MYYRKSSYLVGHIVFFDSNSVLATDYDEVHADKLMAPQVAVKSKAITRAKRATTTVSGTLITHKKARIDSDDPAEAGVENEGLAKFKERRRRCIDTELQLPSETMAEATAFEFRPTARVSLDVGKNIVTATKEGKF